VAGLRARGTFSHAPNYAAAAASGAAAAIVLSAAEGLAFVAFVIVRAGQQRGSGTRSAWAWPA
jgi:hypothetical protein